VLRLFVSDKAMGVFVLYTDKPEFFDAAGLLLLTELAGNVAYAVDHIEKQERLDQFAFYDALTGLANRRLFLDRLRQYMESAASGGHKLAVFLFDLERFRKFNDTLGRPAGDALLKLVAEWLAQSAGRTHLVARVGADQFAMALPEVTYEGGVVQMLDKTIAAFLKHPFRVDDVVYRIAAKVGVVLFPDDGTDAEILFKNAEAALKKAKVSGDRYLFYAQKMNETISRSFGIENRLRQALESEEFELHYQPKVNITSGKLTGAEALIRWNDPRRGLVPPAQFIPILEETGLIHEVGRWALQKAIEDYRRWRDADLPAVRIAVNVSPLQLRNRGFVAQIEEALSTTANSASGLELEITESLIMENVNHSIVSLLAIRALGVTVAIDDFGTGFSSLSYLSKLPVDTLKIDRSFVVDMVAGESGAALVSGIINLAHALKLNAVAEGVETEEQLRQLQLLHCDEMQGYLYGKPVPVEIFEKRHLARSAGLAAEAWVAESVSRFES
jgi:diguanylate cyclase (GGDEF)-like protein